MKPKYTPDIEPNTLSSSIETTEPRLEQVTPRQRPPYSEMHQGLYLHLFDSENSENADASSSGDMDLDATTYWERLERWERLRQSEERLTFTLDATDDGLWDWYCPTGRMEVNRRWLEMLGYEVGEFTGRFSFCRSCCHPEDLPEVTRRLVALLEGRTLSYEFEHRMRHKEGHDVWVLARARIVQRNETGEPLRVIGTNIDITTRKQLEESRERAMVALSESQRRLNEAQAVARIGSWELEVSTGKITWSAEMFRLLGVDPPDGEPDYPGTMRRYHPDDIPPHDALVAQAIQDGQYYECDIRVHMDDGTFRWMQATGRGSWDESGRVVRLLGTLQDITERKRAQTERAAIAEREVIALRDRRVAQTLQLALVPPVRADLVPGHHIFAYHEPLLEEAAVGGDFYDAFPLSGGCWALVVGDVMGKGLPAALSIAEVRFALRGFLSEDGQDVKEEGDIGSLPLPDPSHALHRLNRFLLKAARLEERPRNMMVALVLVVVEPATGRVVITTAGSEPALLARKVSGRIETLSSGHMILGAVSDAVYSNEAQSVQATLEPGDLLLLTTDGISESRGVAQERTPPNHAINDKNAIHLFCNGLLQEKLGEVAQGVTCGSEPEDTDSPTQRAGLSIIEASRSFAGGAFRDDICLLLLERRS